MASEKNMYAHQLEYVWIAGLTIGLVSQEVWLVFSLDEVAAGYIIIKIKSALKLVFTTKNGNAFHKL